MGNTPSSVNPIGPGDHVLRLQIPPSVAQALLSEGMKIHFAVPTPTNLPFQPFADYRGPLSEEISATPTMYNDEIRRSRRRNERLRSMQPRRLFADATFDMEPGFRAEQGQLNSRGRQETLFETTPPEFPDDLDDEDFDANENLMDTSPPMFSEELLDETITPEESLQTPSRRYPIEPPQTAPQFGTPRRIRYIRRNRTLGNTPTSRKPIYDDNVAQEAEAISRRFAPGSQYSTPQTFRTPSSRYPLESATTPQTAPRIGTPQRVRYIRRAHTLGNETANPLPRRTLEYDDIVAAEASRIAKQMERDRSLRRRTYTIRRGSPKRLSPIRPGPSTGTPRR